MLKKILNFWRHNEFDEMDIDSVERIEGHQDLIARKKILHYVYEDFYQTLMPYVDDLPPGPRVELGSGWSFLEEYVPHLIKSDVMKIRGAHVCLDALRLPFADQSISGLFLTNTLHHLPQAGLFFKESLRVLKPNGRLFLVEPYYTIWSAFIWRLMNHEDHTIKGPWEFETTGPLSSANLALSWVIFTRDHQLFSQQFPQLKIIHRQSHTGFAYLLSGGLSVRSLIPTCSYHLVKKIDQILSFLSGGVSDNFETVVIVKK